MATVIESAGITDVGKKRTHNEDDLFIDDKLGLYIVADGMGGHQAGEVASKLVVQTLSDFMQQPEDRDADQIASMLDGELTPQANRLISGIKLANQAVHDVAMSKPKYRGMGSTVSAVLITENRLVAANVGDSPIYLIHDGSIELLSVLHTVMAEHEALDPTGKRQLNAAFKHMLTRGMGIEETVQADISEIQLFKDDALVISSDGLSDKVSPDEIMEIVNGHSVKSACRRLVELALQRGGDDNITVIVLKLKEVSPERQNLLDRLFYKLKGVIHKFGAG